MKTELLKAKILDLLIKGELTAKWRNDHKDVETADVLLEKIRSEKEKKLNEELIAKGKKPNAKVKIEDVTKNDELFEIPLSWKWCHLGEIADRITDFVASGSFADLRENVSYYYEPNYALLVRTTDLSKNFKGKLVYTDESSYKFLSNSNLFGGELILPNIGSIGKIFKIPYRDSPMTLGPNSILLDSNNPYLKEYFFNFFSSIQGQSLLAKISGATAQAKFNKTDFRKIVIPLPPLEEQKEMAQIAEKLLTMVDDVDGSYSNLEELSKKAKAKVLDLLVKGELTAKWRKTHKDIETADVLLETIRNEKEKKLNDELIAKGKKPNAKLEIKEVYKTDEPFEIPSNWRWCRLGEVCSDISDIDHKMPTAVENGIPYISPLNFKKNGSIDFENAKKISSEEFYQLSKKCKPERGDIIFPRYGTIGKLRRVETDIDFLVSYSCATIKPHLENVSADFIFYVLSSSLIQNIEIPKYIKQTTQPNVGLQSIKDFLFPLPPLEEQKEMSRIAKTLLNQIDSLTNIDSTLKEDEENE